MLGEIGCTFRLAKSRNLLYCVEKPTEPSNGQSENDHSRRSSITMFGNITMGTEDLRIAVNAALSDKIVLSLWQVILLIPLCGASAYFGAYLKKRGENLATSEDVRELTNAVKQIETAYAREIESHKVDLLKSKTIYEERLKAYSKFIGLVYQVRPEMSHPDADDADFMRELAGSLNKIRLQLKEYIVENAGILPLEVRNSVILCHSACEIGRFDDFSEETYAPKLWNRMWEADAKFRRHLNLEEEHIHKV